MRFKTTAAISLCLLLIPTVSLAAVFVTGEETARLTEATNDDVYAASREVSISAAVTGDVAAAGEVVEVTGGVTQDVHAAGKTVKIEGQVGDDLHAAGAEVTLSGTVQGDVFLAGSQVQVAAESVVGGDLYVGSADVTISGRVKGNVRAAGQVHVTSSAVIDGGMLVVNNNPPLIDEGATITGETTFKAWEGPEQERTGFGLVGWVRSVVALFLVALIFVYGARGFSRAVIETVAQRSGKSLLVSILWLLLFIPASILLVVSLVGITVAMGIAVLTILVWIAAAGIAAAGVGRWIMGKISKDGSSELSWVHALVGAVVYKGVELLPVVGQLATVVLVLFFFGATLLTLMKLLRNYDSESNAADTHPASA